MLEYSQCHILTFNLLNWKYTEFIFFFRDKHQDIRDGYDRLHRLSAKGPKSKEFIEPKVQGLWKLATESNFSPSELESLRVSLV